MSEIGVDFVLWDATDDTGEVEEKLGVPVDLQQRMKSWVAEYNRRLDEAVPGEPMWTEQELIDFDRWGHALSRELQALLGNEYFVEYKFHTSVLREEVQSG